MIDNRREYYLEGTIHAAGTSFDWLRDNLGVLAKRETIDSAIRRSRQRLWMLPALGGLGAPRWDYKTETTFYGLNSSTTKSDLVRATAEGLCMLVADVAGAMAASGFPIERARVSGGLSRADALMALQAECLGVQLERHVDVEATALGAAVLAARSAGVPDPAAMTRARVEKKFAPRRKESDRLSRRDQWRIFVEEIQRLGQKLTVGGKP